MLNLSFHAKIIIGDKMGKDKEKNIEEKESLNNNYIVIVIILYIMVIILAILLILGLKKQKDTIKNNTNMVDTQDTNYNNTQDQSIIEDSTNDNLNQNTNSNNNDIESDIYNFIGQ